MFYLAKFCRICIQTGGRLIDIESVDHDLVRLSEKLKACTEMVITRESLSTKICTSCIQKLRISYQFQNMCKKSTSILQQYLTELLSVSDGITADKFVNSELRISLPVDFGPSTKSKRKRVGKDERCLLLKKLLSKITQEQIVHNIHINGLERLCDSIRSTTVKEHVHSPGVSSYSIDKEKLIEESLKKKQKEGGLRSLLNFTKEYDFGYKISTAEEQNKNFDLTPLERLERFTEDFFYDHFGDYRETILHASDTIEFDSSDDEELFEKLEGQGSGTSQIHVKEEVIVEPDVTFKKELFYDEDDNTSDYDYTSRFVQACYDNDDTVKAEPEENLNSYFSRDRGLPQVSSSELSSLTTTRYSYLEEAQHSDIGILESLEGCSASRKYRTLSPYSVKCRTRGNPFINPQLKKQFQMRNFKCAACNRGFKSPGYLKAHCIRLKHYSKIVESFQ